LPERALRVRMRIGCAPVGPLPSRNHLMHRRTLLKAIPAAGAVAATPIVTRA